jgi:hypothetical protein
MLAGSAVVAWPSIGKRTVKCPFPIYPTCNRPPALLITVAVLLAYDLDAYNDIWASNSICQIQGRHCRSARCGKPDRQGDKCRSYQDCVSPVLHDNRRTARRLRRVTLPINLTALSFDKNSELFFDIPRTTWTAKPFSAIWGEAVESETTGAASRVRR